MASDVCETGHAYDHLGRRIAIGQDEDSVYLDTGHLLFLFDAEQREHFIKAWALAEFRAEAHAEAVARAVAPGQVTT